MLVPVVAAGLSVGFGFLGHHLHRQHLAQSDYSLRQMDLLLAVQAESTPSLPAEIPGPPPLPVAPSSALDDGLPSSPASLASQLLLLRQGRWSLDRPLRIFQLGDSHTAADFFTERVRSRLQTQFGDGGIGWILPGRIDGQSAARYDVVASGSWVLNRGQQRYADPNVPLGGVVNSGLPGARLVVRPLVRGHGRWRFHAMVRRAPNASQAANVRLFGANRQTPVLAVGSDWQAVDLDTGAPLASRYGLEVTAGRVEVAGFWLENDRPGVVVDHVGRNGATLSAFDSWSDKAIRSQLSMRPVDAIVIAYGTNEAVDNISFADYSRRLSRVVSRLRAVAPGVEIVVVTAPSFAKGGGACPASRPRSLQSVISAQLAAGQWPGVQVWNWMDAMGGVCAVNQWSSQGLMARDRIHMTVAGYRRSADLFANWLQLRVRNAGG